MFSVGHELSRTAENRIADDQPGGPNPAGAGIAGDHPAARGGNSGTAGRDPQAEGDHAAAQKIKPSSLLKPGPLSLRIRQAGVRGRTSGRRRRPCRFTRIYRWDRGLAVRNAKAGYRDFVVQDLRIEAHNIRYRRTVYLLPDGTFRSPRYRPMSRATSVFGSVSTCSTKSTRTMSRKDGCWRSCGSWGSTFRRGRSARSCLTDRTPFTPRRMRCCRRHGKSVAICTATIRPRVTAGTTPSVRTSAMNCLPPSTRRIRNRG